MSASKIKNLILLIFAARRSGAFARSCADAGGRRRARAKRPQLEELYSSCGLTLDASSLPTARRSMPSSSKPDASMPRRHARQPIYRRSSRPDAYKFTPQARLDAAQPLRELAARLTRRIAGTDLARATRRYLRSMDFTRRVLSRAATQSAGVYSVTAVQGTSAACPFLKARSFTYHSSAPFPASMGRFTRRARQCAYQSACISCADALVCLLPSRDSLGWVGGKFFPLRAGYVRSGKRPRKAMRFMPVWRIRNGRGGTFHISGITRGTSAGVIRRERPCRNS